MTQPPIPDCPQLDQIYRSAEECFERGFKLQVVCEAGSRMGFEVDQDVNIAMLMIKVVAQNGSEQLHLAHTVKAAQVGYVLSIVFHENMHCMTLPHA